MKRLLLAVCVVMIAGVAHAKDDRMSILDLYNHDDHNGYFEAAKFDCKNCHPSEKSFSRQAVNLRGCHQCHNNPKAPAPAPQECELCHNDNLQPIKPENHRVSWLRLHSAFAKQNAQDCAVCHRNSWCVDCHQQRDSIRQTMHPRNYRFIHSIEARANPARCDRCHTVDFCTSCHTLRRIP